MLRNKLKEALKESMKTKDERSVSTVRLILAAQKDRDITARGKGNVEGIPDDEILGLLAEGRVRAKPGLVALHGPEVGFADGYPLLLTSEASLTSLQAGTLTFEPPGRAL